MLQKGQTHEFFQAAKLPMPKFLLSPILTASTRVAVLSMRMKDSSAKVASTKPKVVSEPSSVTGISVEVFDRIGFRR